MPSPFPGMDPYLENPSLWPDVHHELISVAREFLSIALRPRYFVQIDERLYVADDPDDMPRGLVVPDISVRAGQPSSVAVPGVSASAVAEPGIEVEGGWEVEVREARICIVDRESQRAITIIEFLSPANKTRGSAGRQNYEEKKREVLSSGTNLVEIDLLRTGVPLYRGPSEPFDYLAQVWRWTGERHRRWIWPMRLQSPLKSIPVPLRPGDPDGVLELQRILDTSYSRAGYELRVDYSREPTPPLSGNYLEWARATIGSAAT